MEVPEDGPGGLHGHLVQRLQASTDLAAGEADRVVREVLDYFSESTEELVRRRHRELHGEGLVNPIVYRRIRAELGEYRVRVPTLSERQIRRIVYG